MALIRMLGAVGLAGVLYSLHRLALWLESRGRLNYTRASRKSRASLMIAAAFDPRARQILELQEREDDEQDESGEDAKTRAPVRRSDDG